MRGLLLAAAWVLASGARADDMASASHKLGPTVVDSGGGTSTGATNRFLFSVSETATGVSSGPSGQYRMGFAHLLRTAPSDALQDLIALVQTLALGNGYSSKLDNAASALASGNTTAAANMVQAFINYVDAQSGKKQISADLAASLTALANQVVALIASYNPAATASAAPAAAFELGEHYCFPNPAKGVAPTFHLEAGAADQASVHVYDVSGALLHGADLGSPAPIGGSLAFESRWDTSGVGSGVYIYAFTAKKAGHGDLKAIGKCAVVK